jgi:hypothetical protein
MVLMWEQTYLWVKKEVKRVNQDTQMSVRTLPKEVMSTKFSTITSWYKHFWATSMGHIPLRRRVWPHLQRSHCPTILTVDHTTSSPFWGHTICSSTYMSCPSFSQVPQVRGEMPYVTVLSKIHWIWDVQWASHGMFCPFLWTFIGSSTLPFIAEHSGYCSFHRSNGQSKLTGGRL